MTVKVEPSTYLLIGAGVVVLAAGGYVFYRSKWFQLRQYAYRFHKVMKEANLEEKAKNLQRAGDNPQFARKPMQEMAVACRGVADALNRISPPPLAREIHEEAVQLHVKAAAFYQMVAAGGGYRQKELQRRQKELQQLERALGERMQSLFGKPPKPKSA